MKRASSKGLSMRRNAAGEVDKKGDNSLPESAAFRLFLGDGLSRKTQSRTTKSR